MAANWQQDPRLAGAEVAVNVDDRRRSAPAIRFATATPRGTRLPGEGPRSAQVFVYLVTRYRRMKYREYSAQGEVSAPQSPIREASPIGPLDGATRAL